MKVIDFINVALSRSTPTYLCDTFESSAFQVLHQAFIVLGNGLQWANTGDPETGGYLTHPKMLKDNNDWVRLTDMPYAFEKFNLDPRFFKEEAYEFGKIDLDLVNSWLEFDSTPKLFMTYTDDVYPIYFQSDLERLLAQKHIWIEGMSYIKGTHTHMLRKLTPGKYIDKKSPYPNFSKEFSVFWEIEPELIQKDWRKAGIKHLKYWQHYFNKPSKYIYYKGFSTPESLKNYFNKVYRIKYKNWIERCRSKEGYDFPEFDGKNFKDMAEYLNKRRLNNIRKFLSETINRLEQVEE